ncbi:G-protein coupled receptor moody-like [Diadema setosum]|uniref:G-protein coupled receptor moody-like n=1 Tax=Diadema setosum TaxID=31175 RepID=UPI003B3B3F45
MADDRNDTMSDDNDVDVDFTNYGGRIAISTYFIAVCLFGLVGNLMVVAAVINFTKMRSVTNVFICSLAVSDIATCLVIPWMVVGILSPTGWPLSDWFCVTIAIARDVTLGSSVWHLVAIGVNRMVLVTMSPVVYQRIYQRGPITAMIAATWLIPFIVVIIPCISGAITLGFDHDTKLCSDLERDASGRETTLLAYIEGIFLSCLPLAIVLSSYIRIFVFVKRHLRRRSQAQIDLGPSPGVSRSESFDVVESKSATKKSRRARQMYEMDSRITKNCFFVVLGFLLCIIPYGVCILAQFGFRGVPLAMVFLLLNACLNPVIYGTKHPHFKTALLNIIQARFSRDSNIIVTPGGTSQAGKRTTATPSLSQSEANIVNG